MQAKIVYIKMIFLRLGALSELFQVPLIDLAISLTAKPMEVRAECRAGVLVDLNECSMPEPCHVQTEGLPAGTSADLNRRVLSVLLRHPHLPAQRAPTGGPAPHQLA